MARCTQIRLEILYDLPSTPVGVTLTHQYDIMALAGHVFEHIYDIAGPGAAFEHQYDIFSKAALTLTHKYDVAENAAPFTEGSGTWWRKAYDPGAARKANVKDNTIGDIVSPVVVADTWALNDGLSAFGMAFSAAPPASSWNLKEALPGLGAMFTPTGAPQVKNRQMLVFDGAGGHRIKGSTLTGLLKSTGGIAAAATAGVDYLAPPLITELTGVIKMYGGAGAPSGYLLCDGSAVSRTTYAGLFVAISTTFGTGDGSTTFNVPDFRGIFPKGAGTTARTLGKDASGNSYAGVLGTYLTDKMQGHIHTGQLAGVSILIENALASISGGGQGPTDDGVNGIPRTGHTTEPQSLGITFIIKT